MIVNWIKNTPSWAEHSLCRVLLNLDLTILRNHDIPPSSALRDVGYNHPPRYPLRLDHLRLTTSNGLMTPAKVFYRGSRLEGILPGDSTRV